MSNDFIDYLNTFDLICLTETFVDEGFEITALKEFIIFIAPAKKLSRQGRRSGGIVVSIRKCFAHLFRQVTVKFDNFIVLDSSKALLNTDKDVLFIFVYIPPSGSPAYAQTADGVGAEQIEHCQTFITQETNSWSSCVEISMLGQARKTEGVHLTACHVAGRMSVCLKGHRKI